MDRTSEYRPLRRTGRATLRWQWLRRRARMQPAWPWWAAWCAGGTVVGGVADAVADVPWWTGTAAGLGLGALTVAATALDDVRRPLASLRVLASEVRHPGPLFPGRADAVRAEAFGIPLYAPIDAPDAVLRGGGASYGPRLFSPARRRITVGWGGEDGRAETRVDDDHTRDGWLLDGWWRTRPHDEVAATDDCPADELRAAVHDWEVHLDGRPHRGRAVDLGPWGGGWCATVPVDERHRLDLTGDGGLPADLHLVRRDPWSLVAEPDRP